MTPTFCSTALAERIERAEAGLIAAGADAAQRRGNEGFEIAVAGGAACFAGENSPFNKVVGLGFGGVRPTPNWTRSKGLSRSAAVRPRSSWPTWRTPRSLRR